MNTDRVRELYARVRDCDAAGRAALLDEACGSDLELRAEVESLLLASEGMGRFLETPAAARLGAVEAALPPGERVGGYEIVSVLGKGGAGTVYEALQESPHRRVALKVMRAGLGSAAAVKRFQEEAEILALLQHPGIAHVYEAGVHESGAPWFAMEYVPEAQTLIEYADGRKLATAHRLELVARVCDAIHYGHQQGILHRDVKPGNILVMPGGDPKIIDFGIARAADASGALDVMGTLAYMAPEQCDPKESRSDVRSDVYALGVVLYELLVGRLPHDLARTSLTEALRRKREEAPTPITTLDRALRGDVAAIVGKALDPERERRYRSAAALADDIRRHLDDRPVEARPHGLLYQLSKFARRQRLAFGALCAVVVVSLAAAVVSGLLAVAKERERAAAEFQAYLANIGAAEAALRVHDVPEAASRLRRAPAALRNWEWRYLTSRLDLSERTLVRKELFQIWGRFCFGGTGVLSTSNDNSTWRSLLTWWDPATGRQLRTHEVDLVHVASPVISPDGRWLAWGTHAGQAWLMDAKTMQRVATLEAHGPKGEKSPLVRRVAFNPAGDLLVTCADDGTARLWTVPGGEPVRTLTHGSGKYLDVAFGAHGTRLAVGASDNTVKLWDLESYALLHVLEGHREPVWSVAFLKGAVVSASSDATIRVWDPDTGETRLLLTATGPVQCVTVSDDGRWILSGHRNGTVNLWDARIGAQVATFWGHEGPVVGVSVTPDFRKALSSSPDGTMKIWDLARSGPALIADRHKKLTRGLVYSPDGRRLACASFDHTVKVYDTGTWDLAAPPFEHDNVVICVGFRADGRLLASGSNDGTVRIWDLKTGERVATLSGHKTGLCAVSFSPDGGYLVSGSTDSSAILWDTSTWERLRTFELGGWVWAALFSPDGSVLATGGADGQVLLRRTGSWQEIRRIDVDSSGLTCAAFHPDGTILATGTQTGVLELWKVPSGRRLAVHRSPRGIQALSFSPDGTRIAGNVGTKVTLWDVSTGQRVIDLRGHTAPVYGVAFSPDGARIASGGGGYDGEDCTIRIWGAEWPLPGD